MRAVPLIALALSLTALAVAAWPSSPPPAPAPEPVAPAVSPAQLEALERRVEALEDSTSDLWSRVARAQPGAVAASDGGVDPMLVAEVGRLREQVHGLMVGEVLNSDQGRVALKEAVKSAQLELASERAQTARADWVRSLTEGGDARAARWKQFATEAQLTWAQEQELTRRLQAEEAARKAMATAVESGTPLREARQALQTERRQTDEAMRKTLNPEQVAKYEAARVEERRSEFPGRGGGGPGQGGPGPGGPGGPGRPRGP